MIYKSFVLSNFNFCPLVWHFCGLANTHKIERLNECALRFALDDFKVDYQTLLNMTSMPSLYLQRVQSIATEAFKCINNINPPFMHNMLEEKNVNYNLRNDSLVLVPKVNTTNYGLHSFRFYASHLWNILPNHIKNCDNVLSFKCALKDWSDIPCSCMMCNVYTF